MLAVTSHRSSARFALTAVCFALSTSVSLAAPPDDGSRGELKRLGKTVIQYRDDTIRAVVSFRHANRHLDEPWILLETAYMTTGNASLEIAREDIVLRLPDGTRVPLPSQKRVIEEFPDVRRFVREVAVSRDPIEGYFNMRNREESIRLFAVPGEGIVFDQFFVSGMTLSYGDLLFKSPKGSFPSGEYVLEIHNKDVDARIPFTMPAGDVDAKKGNEKDREKPLTW